MARVQRPTSNVVSNNGKIASSQPWGQSTFIVVVRGSDLHPSGEYARRSAKGVVYSTKVH